MTYFNCTPHIVRVYTPSHVTKETTWKGRDGLANKIVQEFDPVEKAWRLPREFAMPEADGSVVKYMLKSGMLPKWVLDGTNTQLRVEYQDRFAGGDPDSGITERRVIAVDTMFFSAFDSGMKLIVSFQYLQAVKDMVTAGLLDKKYQQSLVTTGPAVFSAGKQVGCLNLVVEG